MTEVPDWASADIPWRPVHQPPANQWTRPFTPQQLQEIGKELIEQFIRQVVLAVVGSFIPGNHGAAFDQLKAWADDLPNQIVAFINAATGLNFASWSAFVASLDDNHGIDLPVLPQLLAALDGIDLDGDPGAVLRAIIERLASAVPDLFSISRITNAIQDLARGAGEFLNADALIDGPFEWDDLTPGWLSGKSAKATADGTTQIIRTDVFEVFEGQTLSERAAAMWAGYSGSGATISTGWSFYDAAGALISDVAKGSITPPGSSGAWQWIPVTGHTVPAGVKYAAQFLQLGSGATAGNVWFSNARPWASNLGAQDLIQDLPEDLEALLDWLTNFVEAGLSKLGVPAVGTLFDKINDLTDEWAILQGDADDALAGLADKLGVDEWDDWLDDTVDGWQALLNKFKGGSGGALSDVQTVVTQLNQIGDILGGAVVTPINSFVQDVKDWFDAWFGGGSTNAIPLSQKGAASGVAPLNGSTKLATSYLETNVNNGVPKLNASGKLDLSAGYVETNAANKLLQLNGSNLVPGAHLPDMSSTYQALGGKGVANGYAPLNSNAVVPLANLPEEVGGSGGTGDGRPYVIIFLSADQSIANNTKVSLTGWSQLGTTAVTFEDGSNTRWQFGLAGLWLIEMRIRWDTNTTGLRAAEVTRNIEGVESPIMRDSCAAADTYEVSTAGSGGVLLAGSTVERVSDWSVDLGGGIVVDYTAEDWFQARVRHTRGSALNVKGDAGPAAGVSQVICTYLGAS